jgi:hypothetical protein
MPRRLYAAHVGFSIAGGTHDRRDERAPARPLREASFAEFWAGGLIGSPCIVRIWSVKGESLPPTPEGKIEWLNAEWRKVDRFVALMRR